MQHAQQQDKLPLVACRQHPHSILEACVMSRADSSVAASSPVHGMCAGRVCSALWLAGALWPAVHAGNQARHARCRGEAAHHTSVRAGSCPQTAVLLSCRQVSCKLSDALLYVLAPEAPRDVWGCMCAILLAIKAA